MKSEKNKLFLWLVGAVTSVSVQAQQVIELPGYQMAAQAVKPNVKTQWTYRPYDNSFYDQSRFAAYRSDTSIQIPYFLTPQTYFVGEESRVQQVSIPADWQDRVVTLELERVHIVSHVYVNGVEARSLYHASEVGMGCRSLGAPHRYDLTGLVKAGENNELRIVVDNSLKSVPVGCNSYSVSDDDQGNWNGYVGHVRLMAQPASRLIYDATQIYPVVKEERATVQLLLGKGIGKPEKLKLRIQSEAGTIDQPVILSGDSQRVEIQLSGMNRLWDEYQPNLYHLSISLLDKKGHTLDHQDVTFGMREVTADQHFIRINGRRTYLRGTVDGAQFPMTGYPPMDVPYWTEYINRLKPWGINVVRFHSWCPPEAAFVAADSLGMYMQVECSSWPNHDVSLSPGNPTDLYIRQESEQILQAYGNHPSLILLAGGNEPKGKDWVDAANQWVNTMQSKDPRRLYYAYAVGGSWAWASANQVNVRAGYRGVDWDRRRPECRTDFNAALDTMNVPFIGHEVGQWSTYPALKDIPKFDGFMRSAHSEICRDMLEQNGMGALADSFLLASGRLQVLCYKSEIERIRRTRYYGGYGLQALADYTGQGTSNEGILNVFLEPKGYVEPAEWLQWSGEVVPLMRTSQFTYQSHDTLRFSLELSNLGRDTLLHLPVQWQLRTQSGRILKQREYPARDFPWGGCLPIGEEQIALSSLGLSDASALTLEVQVGEYRNDWTFWVYPIHPDLDTADIYVTSVPDAKVQEVLANGGKVLMLCYDKVNMGRNIKQMMLPEFWNHLWSSKYSSHTHGLLIQNSHPIFRHFPTDYHSNLQWWELINRTYPMWMEDLPGVRPLVQSIDNAYSNRRLGMLFEVRVGKGRLVVTNLDLKSKPDQRIVARQLLSSILQYMQTEDFQPQAQVEIQNVMDLFLKFRQM